MEPDKEIKKTLRMFKFILDLMGWPLKVYPFKKRNQNLLNVTNVLGSIFTWVFILSCIGLLTVKISLSSLNGLVDIFFYLRK